MTSLQPIQALSLDSVQQQAFISYFLALPEKPPTTVRIFDRNDYYSVHGEDASTAAKEVFSSISNIKKMGIVPNKLEYLVLSKGNFETLIKKLLLVRRYRVEIYVAETSIRSNDWVLKYKGSPGYLSQLEEVLGDSFCGTEAGVPCLMAVSIKTDPLTKVRLLGVACVSVGDYQMSVCEFTDDELLTELETITVQAAPTECLVYQIDDNYKMLKKVMDRSNVTVTKVKKADFSTDGLIQDLNRLLKFGKNQQHDARLFPETQLKVAMMSLCAAIKYTALLSDTTNFARFTLSSVQSECFMSVDAAALAALGVLPEAGAGGAGTGAPRSLYALLDKCRTQQGKRLLAQWLRQPLRDINLINERLDVVEVMMQNSRLRQQLHEDHLRRMPDLHALARRITRKKATLHDCYRIYQAIKRLPWLLQCLAEANDSTVHSALAEPISELTEDFDKFQQMVEATLDMTAVERGDFLVKPSFDEKLEALSEKLNELQASAEKQLSRAAKDLSLEAGKSIKLETNTQNEFCFRVTLKEEKSLRGNKKYTIVDTVRGGVRFKDRTLETLTEEYLQTKAIYEKEQDKVVAEIVNIAAGYSECLYCLCDAIARLDVLVSYAVSASAAPQPYSRPRLSPATAPDLELRELRHPCLELQDGVSFIPNDVVFKRGTCIMHVVTGANMGGKTTWMRACGLAALMAHAGCTVPASTASLPILRALRARAGAADREHRAQSTFMVEMIDAANILKTATSDSLVLIDELGRGTSTYEGRALAWAIAEDLATRVQCFSIFATHYHEMTRLALAHPGVVANSCAEANVVGGSLVLHHRIAPGAAAESLGLHVAQLAGLPPDVLEYAESLQDKLENDSIEFNCSNEEQQNEGDKIILDFLRKCKRVLQNSTCKESVMAEIKKLKEDLLSTNKNFVESLLLP